MHSVQSVYIYIAAALIRAETKSNNKIDSYHDGKKEKKKRKEEKLFPQKPNAQICYNSTGFTSNFVWFKEKRFFPLKIKIDGFHASD